MSDDQASQRTIALAGHIDSGASTLGHRIRSFVAPARERDAGGVGGEGPLSREALGSIRGIWRDHVLELVSTVGPLRFTRDARGAVPSLSGAVLILDAVAGIQRQTFTADRRIRRFRLPRLIFINKCDRAGADPVRLCDQLRDRLAINPVLLQLPLGREERFVGVVDLVRMRAVRFAGPSGEHPISVPIPEYMRQGAETARERMIVTLSMFSDQLTRAVEAGEVSISRIRAAIRQATVGLQVTPVFLGSAYKSKGVQPLLDAVVRYLPEPPAVRERARADLALSEPSMPSLSSVDLETTETSFSEGELDEDPPAPQPLTGPLRIFEQTERAALGPGHLGVVMARAGEGKSSCLVRMGLDYLFRGASVLHVSLGEIEAQVKTRYRVQIGDLFPLDTAGEKRSRLDVLGRRFSMHSLDGARIDAATLERLVREERELREEAPLTILVDGYGWAGPPVQVRREIAELKRVAADAGAELWITALTSRALTGAHPTSLPPAVEDFDDLIDLAIFLEPRGRQTTVRLLHDAAGLSEGDVYVVLDRTATVIDAEAVSLDEPAVVPTDYTLLSGGAPGAEAEFGAGAERWGVVEVTFSFPGREVARTRGLVELSEAELTLGDVSEEYLQRHLSRSYREDESFRRLLQTIWHQVVSAGQVFVVGEILGDGTVSGGTGWAVELARHWDKPVHVFDQGTENWFSWRDGAWQRVEMLTINTRRFTGTGSRDLRESGRRAIRDLFARTFRDAD